MQHVLIFVIIIIIAIQAFCPVVFSIPARCALKRAQSVISVISRGSNDTVHPRHPASPHRMAPPPAYPNPNAPPNEENPTVTSSNLVNPLTASGYLAPTNTSRNAMAPTSSYVSFSEPHLYTLPRQLTASSAPQIYPMVLLPPSQATQAQTTTQSQQSQNQEGNSQSQQNSSQAEQAENTQVEIHNTTV
jgi:hypothetical protein